MTRRTETVRFEEALRDAAPYALGTLVRRYGQFDACEDAVQEALIAAASSWPADGIPDSPRAWLTTVADRRLTDAWRSESARRRRELAVIEAEPPGEAAVSDDDDTLRLIFLCCHPSLSAPSQLALTLRAVGGLTTAEIASAFLVPEATMAQRISRAKQSIRAAGARFVLPDDEDRSDRLAVVLQVLYLIFNEGYAARSGDSLQRSDLTSEAIRITRMLHRLQPDEGEVGGLLALMLLTDARSAARETEDGRLVPLAEQRRELWDRAAIAEGVALLTRTLGRGVVGPYQLQAAIAAVHDEAPNDDETDWRQILALYDVVERVAPSPVVTLNRAVALARVSGPRAGLALLGTLDGDERLATSHRLDAVRAHLLERAGDLPAAADAYGRAARAALNRQERDYLRTQAARIASALA
ncbi:RNA polymerase sigma factor [Diaminobutyricibacter sp. McL0608]|uniref:RNA polymerase sigma factor n=1 Tax=Leifsonia sp. McL0608 TaxID=3143537 RepID=UPI0031F2E1F5